MFAIFCTEENGKQRLLFDCRVPTRLFNAAPNIPMGTGPVWAHMKIPDNELLYMATSDIRDCFYARDIPEELSEAEASRRRFAQSSANEVVLALNSLDGCE